MATWCTACVVEIPEFKALRAAFSEDQLAMFAVPIDQKDSSDMLRAWQAKIDPPYELLVDLPTSDVEKVKKVIASELRDERRVPATIVTDSDGRVLLTCWDAPSISELRKLLWKSDMH